MVVDSSNKEIKSI